MDMAAEAKEEERIENGSILWYTRQDPQTGEVQTQFGWQLLATPWKPSFCDPNWKRLKASDKAHQRSNQEMLDMCNRFPRMYPHSMVGADHLFDIDRSQLMVKPELLIKRDSPDQEFENRFANFRKIFDPNAQI